MSDKRIEKLIDEKKIYVIYWRYTVHSTLTNKALKKNNIDNLFD